MMIVGIYNDQKPYNTTVEALQMIILVGIGDSATPSVPWLARLVRCTRTLCLHVTLLAAVVARHVRCCRRRRLSRTRNTRNLVEIDFLVPS